MLQRSAEYDFISGLAQRLDPFRSRVEFDPNHVIRLRTQQELVYFDSSRFRVVIAGRRWGKTVLALLLLLEAAIKNPGCAVWYTVTTFRQAKRIAWRKFKQLIPQSLVARTNETELFIDLTNGSRITLVGRERPDDLRGEGLARIVNDEFAANERGDKGLATWETVLRPMLSDTGGDAIFISTPRGFNWGYDFFVRGQEKEYDNWASWRFTSLEGGNIPDDEIAEARRDLDPKRFAQEYEASFETLAGLIYDTFDRFVHVDDGVTDDGGVLHIGQDFNIDPMASVVARRVGPECHVINAHELPSTNTDEMCREMKRLYCTGDRTPGMIVFHPDPTGKARKTSAGTGKTDHTIIQSHGFQLSARPSAPPVIDRENNTKAMLMSADGTVRVRIHPRARCLIRALEGLTYKTGTRQRDKLSPLAHVSDAFDYLLWDEFNILDRREAVVEAFSR